MKVKCQVSLHTTAEYSQMLFYTQSRKWQWSGDLSPEWQVHFDQFGPRFFAEVKGGEIIKAGELQPIFVRKLKELGW